ncbi:DegT/DnrJ/EryC1/StrS aminotransferase [Prauserella marina]|uniref:dTDP-4-amino-4,6-dideoxygalactose transaminase n=1 Tax=Prauserella marina TaxID=530584 RepID=A0A222VTW6_9PSEU|nr:DegT/DnrJ/EryC1/StrS family aminotransferase [Prauserella marina]ASR37385.1 DegT/DnrJ/EryC1/StrS aminotransferase [Prauserella marina]PWV74742.1 dTDP-4-amino-4,6-dideoxygalactose transaminase [Prauserella marina]SDD41891.1 dTDP-4-amino-4,6-dideoxygalactose transaminase [Prauserella marina]
MIPLVDPRFPGNEARYLLECIETGYVSAVGPFVGRFEREFGHALGSPHAVACGTGTAALHVALRLSGARPGTLVAVSDFTFIASANAATYTGADLLFVDSESASWNMDTERLHDEVVRRARVGERIPDIVEVVHVLGHPAFLEPLLRLKERFGIRVVEDAAEALGSAWNDGDSGGGQVGTVGDFGCFSFNGNKIITTGGGGMIVSPEAEKAEQARHLINQAKAGEGGYLHDTVGYNYRMTNLNAAVGVAQLEQLPAILAAKRAGAATYADRFAALPLTLPPHAPWAEPSYWLYSVLLPESVEPVDAVAELEAAGVRARRLWPPLHRQAPYRGVERLGGEVAERIYARGISIPSSPGLSEDDRMTVIKAVEGLFTTV